MEKLFVKLSNDLVPVGSVVLLGSGPLGLGDRESHHTGRHRLRLILEGFHKSVAFLLLFWRIVDGDRWVLFYKISQEGVAAAYDLYLSLGQHRDLRCWI